MTQELQLVRKADYRHQYDGGTSHQTDFARGVADLAEAISDKREPYLTARFALHINEIVLTLQYPGPMRSPRKLKTAFTAMEHVSWALT